MKEALSGTAEVTGCVDDTPLDGVPDQVSTAAFKAIIKHLGTAYDSKQKTAY